MNAKVCLIFIATALLLSFVSPKAGMIAINLGCLVMLVGVWESVTIIEREKEGLEASEKSWRKMYLAACERASTAETKCQILKAEIADHINSRKQPLIPPIPPSNARDNERSGYHD